MNRHASIGALLCAGLLAACGQSAVQDITQPPPSTSGIKFFNFGVNAPGVNFYANDTKMTAVTSSSSGAESTVGVVYGGVGGAGSIGDYAAIAPGQYTLTGRIADTTNKDLPISTVTTSIEDGKDYSFYMSGIYDATAKTVDGFVVEDDFVAPPDSVALVRFVNAISNANPMALFVTNSTTGTEYPIGVEVAYKSAGAFTQIPAGSYDLATRYSGSSTKVLTRSAVSFVSGRVYTVTARGDITVTPSTSCGSTNKTCLDNTPNR